MWCTGAGAPPRAYRTRNPLPGRCRDGQWPAQAGAGRAASALGWGTSLALSGVLTTKAADLRVAGGAGNHARVRYNQPSWSDQEDSQQPLRRALCGSCMVMAVTMHDNSAPYRAANVGTKGSLATCRVGMEPVSECFRDVRDGRLAAVEDQRPNVRFTLLNGHGSRTLAEPCEQPLHDSPNAVRHEVPVPRRCQAVSKRKPLSQRESRPCEGEGKCAVQSSVRASQWHSRKCRRVTADCTWSVSTRIESSG